MSLRVLLTVEELQLVAFSKSIASVFEFNHTFSGCQIFSESGSGHEWVTASGSKGVDTGRGIVVIIHIIFFDISERQAGGSIVGCIDSGRRILIVGGIDSGHGIPVAGLLVGGQGVGCVVGQIQKVFVTSIVVRIFEIRQRQ